jgi:hypothetical protein
MKHLNAILAAPQRRRAVAHSHGAGITESLIAAFVAGKVAREYLDNHLEHGAEAGRFSAAYARKAAAMADNLAALFARNPFLRAR